MSVELVSVCTCLEVQATYTYVGLHLYTYVHSCVCVVCVCVRTYLLSYIFCFVAELLLSVLIHTCSCRRV